MEKIFRVPIPDDDVYYGPRWFPLQLWSPTGGVLVNSAAVPNPSLYVAEDEPRPVCSIGAGVAVVEGDSGRTSFSVPVHLSAPLANDVSVAVFYIHQTAVENDFVQGGSLTLRAGETSFAVTGWIAGDRIVEEDETFIVRLFPLHTNEDPSFAQTDATITIINDDAEAAQLAPIPTLSWAGYSLFILAWLRPPTRHCRVNGGSAHARLIRRDVGRRISASGSTAASRMNLFATSKQLFRVERLSETCVILPNRLGCHFGKQIGRPGEQLVPLPFRLELCKDPRSDGVLLCFR